MIFSRDTVACFKRFSLSLVAVAVTQTATIPLLIVYLWNRGVLPAEISPPAPGLLLEIFRADIFLIGILFCLISKIIEAAMEMNSEFELTV